MKIGHSMQYIKLLREQHDGRIVRSESNCGVFLDNNHFNMKEKSPTFSYYSTPDGGVVELVERFRCLTFYGIFITCTMLSVMMKLVQPHWKLNKMK